MRAYKYQPHIYIIAAGYYLVEGNFREQRLSLLVVDRRVHNNIVALLPVDRGGHLVLVTKLQSYRDIRKCNGSLILFHRCLTVEDPIFKYDVSLMWKTKAACTHRMISSKFLPVEAG